MSEKVKYSNPFPRKSISSNGKSGPVEGNSNNKTENFLPKRLKLSIQFPKLKKNLQFFHFFLKFYLWTRKIYVRHFLRETSTRNPKIYRSISENVKKYSLIPKIFPRKNSSGDAKLGFGNLAERLSTKRRICFAQSPKFLIKKFSFWKDIMVIKKMFWRRRMLVWKPCRKKFDRRPISFYSQSKNDFELFFKKNCPQFFRRWTRQMKYPQACPETSTRRNFRSLFGNK